MLTSYNALSSSSNRADVNRMLSAIATASLSSTSQDRCKLVQTLLNDIQRCVSPDETQKKGCISKQDARQALLALKTLGREPGCSRVLSTESNLRILLDTEKVLRSEDADAADETLRCVANALLLVEGGRSTWAEVGGVYCVDLLEETNNVSTIFLVCRILFLSTASSSSPFLQRLLDDFSDHASSRRDVVSIISTKLDFLLPAILRGEHMSKEAIIDLLKFAFNLLCHWPRMADDAEDVRATESEQVKESGKTSVFGDERSVLGERWTKRLDKILPSLRRIYIGLPPCSPSPLSAPMTHVLHALLPIPIIDRLFPAWFPEGLEESQASDSCGRSPSSDSSIISRSQDEGHVQDQSSIATSGSKVKEKEREGRGALDRALSMLNSRMSLSRSPSPASPSTSKKKDTHQSSTPSQILRRSVELLDTSLGHYLPGTVDPDDASVKQICAREDIQLDHVLSPLVLLLTRLCKHNLECRKVFRQAILPSNLDRTNPLETRANTLGRCIRLMACINHSQLKEAVGELLFVACDSDAQILSSQIGYGNAAGYLFNRGILSAPPSAEDSGASDSVNSMVNPITGTIQQERTPGPEMTDEEKEREAEKLFVLFERLEKTGAMENPLKKALHEGKLEKYKDQARKDDSDDD